MAEPPPLPAPPDFNPRNPAAVADLFDRAAAVGLECPLRRGSTIHLPPTGRLVMSGDLHDHSLNYQRLVKLAALDHNPDFHLVLHELAHGRHLINHRDMSIRLLIKAAALKLQYPGQVHMLLANHDLAQVTGNDILKNGHSVIDAFNQGVEFIFGDEVEKVTAALTRWIRSLPLAVRCPQGILCSHSLPSPSRFDKFDMAVLDRVATEADLAPGGSAHLMIWGRNHTQELADDLADAWNVRLFVMGHQPAEMGYETEGNSMIVLASDHDHGVALPIDLARDYTLDQLIEHIIPLAGVSMEGT